MAVVEISKIQVRRGQENTTGVPILDSGEFGWASDTERLYIGLRRIDGGARDANVRILTENDLRNFFTTSVSGATGSTSSNYTFRNDTYVAVTGTSYTTADLIVRSVQKKLDDFVNVKDFGATGDGSNVDTANLQAALSYLYWSDTKNATGVDTSYNTYTEKTLYFPAGVYKINETLEIVGKTRIMGEGIENTKIVQLSTGSSVFRTVYNNSQFSVPLNTIKFSFGVSGGGASNLPNNISIEKLSLKHEDSNLPVSNPFILLEESSNVTIRDVKIEGITTFEAFTASTTSSYVGIEVRSNTGTYNVRNIVVENCQFENLFAGFRCDYDVENINIDKCTFSKLDKGVLLSFVTGTSVAFFGPRHVKVTNSYFDEIRQEGIYAGMNPYKTPSYHLSQGNIFEDVGNEGYGPATETGTAIISFLSESNISRNDFFRRYYNELASSNLTTSTAHPLFIGNVTVSNDITHSLVLPEDSTSTVLLVPLINQPQVVDVKYLLTDDVKVDRQGYLKINIKHGANPPIYVEEGYNFYTGAGPTFTEEKNAAKGYYKLKMNNPKGPGSGFQIQVTRAPFPAFTGVSTTGTYTSLVLLAPGAGYVAGETLTVNGGALGGTSPDNDLSILVGTVNITGGVTAATISGGQSANITTSTTYGPIGTFTTNREVSSGPLKFTYQTAISTQRV